ncbi:hypothetical protein QGP82_00120 [Leptothoe sp. LEGE 181152]|nr:hypothetical protein [Leptothoe sp. LEGE 181152]
MTISAIQKKPINWWVWVLGVDFLLILNTGIYKYLPDFSARGYLGHFLLWGENNLAVWWSSINLFVVGCLAYEVSCHLRVKTRSAWWVLAILFIALSADELGSFHERVGGWFNLLPYAIAAVALLTYALILLFREKQSRFSATCILLGFTIFGLVAVQEYFEHALEWPYWLSGIRVAMEEGSELVGMFLCLLALVRQRQNYLSSSSLMVVVPNPWRMKFLSFILLAGTAFHFVISLYVVSALTASDFIFRGNPAIYYPSMVAFLLFCALIWCYLEPISDRHLPWLMLSIYFLICSMLIIDPINWFGISTQFYLLYFVQIVVIGLGVFYADRNVKTVNYNFLRPLSILVGLSLIGVMVRGIFIQHLLSGFLYYGLYESLAAKKLGAHQRADFGHS